MSVSVLDYKRADGSYDWESYRSAQSIELERNIISCWREAGSKRSNDSREELGAEREMSIDKRRDHITRIRWQAQEIERAARLIGAIQVKTQLDKSVADAISTTVTEAYFQLDRIADEIQESIKKEQTANA